MTHIRHPLLAFVFLTACFGGSDDGDADGDGWAVEQDCDDEDAGVHPDATEIPDDGIDQDCDGTDLHIAPDNDGDGVDADSDCDDDDPLITPGRPEYCNAQDDNCDGVVDEGFDGDGDGVTPCGPDGESGTVDDDCDDSDPARSPNLPELCGGPDEDCDSLVDEGFDADGDGVTTCGPDSIDGTADDDCDDNDPDVRPGNFDDCDGVDTNCNGTIDEDGPAGCNEDDLDGDGFAPPADCDETSAEVHPDAVEVCNGRDDDCDGTADEDFDQDGDGWLTCLGDCDDADPNIHPEAPDTPGNGLDEDCSGADQVSDCDGPWFTLGEFEPNNSVNGPNLITTSDGHVTVTGILSCGGDEDHLLLSFGCGGPVTFELTAEGEAGLAVTQGSVLGSDSGGSPLTVTTSTDAGQIQVAITCVPGGGGAWSLLVDWD